MSTLRNVALSAVFLCSFGIGCGDDDTSNPSSGGAGGTSSGGSPAAGTGVGGQGAGGPGGSGANGAGGAGADGGAGASGGSGGEGGFPWDDAIDPNGGPSSDRLIAHPLDDTDAPRGFYEYTPAGYPADVSWPLLIALHGIGENGNNNAELTKVLNAGIPKMINNDNWPNDRPFVVLAPQHPGGGCPGADEIEEFIAWGIDNYAIDTRYVYLTGLSCGAIGSWGYLAKYLDTQIAAFVPVAGDGENAWNNQGCDLGQVAIWAFHGDKDPTVLPKGTHIPMDGLAQCPSPPALENKKTIYPDVTHNSWDMTYDLSAGHDIYTWMLGFTHE